MASDDFNRADGSLGGLWVDVSSRWDILTNRAHAGGGEAIAYYNEARTPDQSSIVEMVGTVESTSGQGGGPACRVQSDGSNYHLSINSTNGCVVKKDDYSGFVFGAVLKTIACTPVSGDFWEIRAVGNLISVYQNGVLLDSVSNSSYASGKVGFFGKSTNADTLINSWTGSDVVGGPVGPTAGFSVVVGGLTATVTDASVAGDNPIVTKLYDYGDGTAQTASTTHTYATRGSFTITQYVNDGVTSEQSTTHSAITKTSYTHSVIPVYPKGKLGRRRSVTKDRPDA